MFVVKIIEITLVILAHCFLSERKSEIHLRRHGFTHMALSFWSSICDGIVLKAVETTNKRQWADVSEFIQVFLGMANKYENDIVGTRVLPVGKLMMILKQCCFRGDAKEQESFQPFRL